MIYSGYVHIAWGLGAWRAILAFTGNTLCFLRRGNRSADISTLAEPFGLECDRN